MACATPEKTGHTREAEEREAFETHPAAVVRQRRANAPSEAQGAERTNDDNAS